MEVIVLGLIEVRQVPIHANVLQAQIVPVVVVWVVRNLVVMHVLSRHETSSHLDKLTTIDLRRSAGLLLVLGGDPAAFDNQGSAIDADRIA